MHSLFRNSSVWNRRLHQKTNKKTFLSRHDFPNLIMVFNGKESIYRGFSILFYFGYFLNSWSIVGFLLFFMRLEVFTKLSIVPVDRLGSLYCWSCLWHGKYLLKTRFVMHNIYNFFFVSMDTRWTDRTCKESVGHCRLDSGDIKHL